MNHRRAEVSMQRLPALVSVSAVASEEHSMIRIQPSDGISFVKAMPTITAPASETPAGWGVGPQKAFVSELGTLPVEAPPTPTIATAPLAPASAVSSVHPEMPETRLMAAATSKHQEVTAGTTN